MTTSTKLRPTYKRRGMGWEGVVKDGTKIVAECGHNHRNRDQWSSAWGPSATDCSRRLVREMTEETR